MDSKPFIKFLRILGSWRAVADAARTTIRMPEGEGEPTPKWKKRILLAEQIGRAHV